MPKLKIEFTNPHDLVQYLAASVICRGYWFYVSGHIPAGKDPTAIDKKLIRKYDANIPKTSRWRRRRAGESNIRYLRHGQHFYLFATKGKAYFFDEESANIRDIREQPLRIAGYSISFRRDGRDQSRRRVHVRIADDSYRDLLATFEHLATRLKADTLAAKLYSIPYRGYAPVRSQLCQLLRAVNRKRKRAGLSKLPKDCLFFHRPPLTPRMDNEPQRHTASN